MTNKKPYSLLLTGILIFVTIIVFGQLAGVVGTASASPAADNYHTLSQPDGTQFEAKQWGDEFNNGWEAQNGYTITKTTEGWWMYATLDSGAIAPTNHKVGIDNPPTTVEKHLRSDPQTNEEFSQDSTLRTSTDGPERSPLTDIPTTGTVNIPVILINYNDTSTSYGVSDYQSLIFGDNPSIATGPGSMKDYYDEVSDGQLNLSGGSSGVQGWYTADNGHNYYGSNDAEGDDARAGELVYEAVKKADSDINYSEYDNNNDGKVDGVMVIFQGAGESTSGDSTDIWPHQWYLSAAGPGTYQTDDGVSVNRYSVQSATSHTGEIATIGTYAHETGHIFGLPDLYDYDYSSNGIGRWGLMSYGGYGSINRSGDSPTHMTAYHKWAMDWVSPSKKSLTGSMGEIDPYATTHEVFQWRDNPNGVEKGGSGQYFLATNRRQVGFDKGLPGQGLIISHIDESQLDNDNENHKLVDIEAADGNKDLDNGRNTGDDGDTYPESIGTDAFNTTSTPNSDLYNGSSSGLAINDIVQRGDSVVLNPTSADIVVADDGSGEYTSVQNAVDNASDNNTIEVKSGTYLESVDVNKDVNIVAPDGATIIPHGESYGIKIAGGAEPQLSNLSVEGSNYTAVNARSSTGDWTIQSLKITGFDTGIETEGSSGRWDINNTVIKNSESSGISAVDSKSDWTIKSSRVSNISGVGINAYNQPAPSQATIQNVTISSTENHGVNFFNSSGDWKITGSSISNNSWAAIEGSESSGDWNVTNTTLENASHFSVGARGATGSWNIRNSEFLNSDTAINAAGASEGDISYNYWGAGDGPSADFAGSGGAVVGNVSVNPYYTGSDLTTTNTVNENERSTLTVDSDGNNGNYTVIHYAVEDANSGDTINVLSGTYTESSVLGSVDITKSIHIIGNPAPSVRGPGTNAPVLDGGRQPTDAFRFEQGVSNVTIAGFEIRNYGNISVENVTRQNARGMGVDAYNASASQVTIRDNYIHTVGWSGMAFSGNGYEAHKNLTISRNNIENTAFYGIEVGGAHDTRIKNNSVTAGTNTADTLSFVEGNNSDGGIAVWANSRESSITTRNVTVENNSITGAFDIAGIEHLVNDFKSQGAPANLHASSQNITIRKNVISNHTGVGILHITGGINTSASNVTLSNNTIRDGGAGVVIDTDRTSTALPATFKNNHIKNNSDGIFVTNGTNPSALSLNKNRIVDNTQTGIYHNGTGLLTADYNYWGTTDGPGGKFSGSGNNVIGNVSVNPFYADDALTSLSTVQDLTTTPSLGVPENGTYDPNYPITIGIDYDATGIIEESDLEIRLVNITSDDNTTLATNKSAPVAVTDPQNNSVNFTISSNKLSGDVTVETRLINTSTQTINATDSFTLTAIRVENRDTGNAFESLQTAIANASEGETLEIKRDLVLENRIAINTNNLTITSGSDTIRPHIRAQEEVGISISANNTVVKKVSLQTKIANETADVVGILAGSSQNTKIKNTTLRVVLGDGSSDAPVGVVSGVNTSIIGSTFIAEAKGDVPDGSNIRGVLIDGNNSQLKTNSFQGPFSRAITNGAGSGINNVEINKNNFTAPETGNAEIAIKLTSTSSPAAGDNYKITNNKFISYPGPLYLSDYNSVTENVSFNGNYIQDADGASFSDGYAVFIGGTVEPANATRNWWGASDGPSGIGSGNGSLIGGDLSYKPYYVDQDLETLSGETPEVPPSLENDVTTEQYGAVLNGSDTLTASTLANAVNGWSTNGQVNDVEIGAFELSELINYWADK